MSKLSGPRKQVQRSLEIGTVNRKAPALTDDLDVRIEMIQCLIPLGLHAVAEELQRAVKELVGRRYQRKGTDHRLSTMVLYRRNCMIHSALQML